MNWLAFLLMLPHLNPRCLRFLRPTLSLAVDALKVVSLLVAVALFIRAFVKEKRLPALPTWMLVALEGWICLITLINKGDYLQTFNLAVSVVGIALLVDLYSECMKELLAALMLNFEWIAYANLYTVVKWPNLGIVQDEAYGGMPIFFFGPDNWFMYLSIPAICVAMLYLRTQWKTGKPVWKVIAFVRATGLIYTAYECVLRQWPATALAALAGLTVVWVVTWIPGIRWCISAPVVLAGGVTASLALVVFRVAERVPQIVDLVQNKLKKNMTFTGRTEIWDKFPELMDGHWFTGIGTPDGGYPIGGRFYDHMHNQAYDLLIQGGIIALVLFLAVLILVGWKLTVYFRKPSARVMTAVLAGVLIMCIPEVCRHCAIFLIFPLAWHVDKIEAACLPRSETAPEEKKPND